MRLRDGATAVFEKLEGQSAEELAGQIRYASPP